MGDYTNAAGLALVRRSHCHQHFISAHLSSKRCRRFAAGGLVVSLKRVNNSIYLPVDTGSYSPPSLRD